MRKISDVKRDLDLALKALKGAESGADNYGDLQEVVRKLTEELNDLVIQDRAERMMMASRFEMPEADAAKRFSFSAFMRGIAQGKLDGFELEMHQEAEKEARESGIKLRGMGIPMMVLQNRAFDGQSVSGGAGGNLGGLLVETDKRYQDALRGRLVLTQAGASYMGGMVGNIEMIEGTAITMGWGSENQEAGDEKMTFSSVSVSPNRAFVNVPISKQLLLQSSFDVEQMIMRNILAAHAELIETAAIKGTGTGYQPTGLLNTDGIGQVIIGANGGALSYEVLLKLEETITAAFGDGGSQTIITNEKVRRAAKATLKSNGIPGYLWGDDNTMIGYRALCSTFVPSNLTKGTSAGKCSAVLFGDFSNLNIFQWGGLDFVYDEYTQKKSGAVEIMLNCYHNVFVNRKQGLAAIKDVTTE